MNIKNKIRLGFIGASPQKGWSSVSHLPALAALSEFEIAAVATTRQQSADAATQMLGAQHAFTDIESLAACDDVDMVVVCVKATDHEAAARAAINAGKAVLCEWPVGTGTAQTAALASLAKQKNVRTFAGLQTRASPLVNHIRNLIMAGYLGEIQSATMSGSSPHWGRTIDAGYSADVDNGAHLLAIPGGHTLDMLCMLLGEFVSIYGETPTLLKSGVVRDTGAIISKSAPDQVALVGALTSGAVVTAHLLGASVSRNHFRLLITGTDGEILLESPGLPGIAPLSARGRKGNQSEFESITAASELLTINGIDPATPAFNLAYEYRWIAKTLLSGEPTPLADFDDAVALHRLLDEIQASDATGKRHAR